MRLSLTAVVLGLVTAAVSLTLLGLLPFALGWSSSVVLTGSMAPRIAPGDVVVLSPVTPARLGPGHVIRFRDPARPGRYLLHRVETVRADGTLTTRGDANPTADTTPVPPGAITGLARLRIPYAGLPSLWLAQRDYPRLALLAVALFLAARTVAALPGLLHPGPAIGLHRGRGRRRLVAFGGTGAHSPGLRHEPPAREDVAGTGPGRQRRRPGRQSGPPVRAGAEEGAQTA